MTKVKSYNLTVYFSDIKIATFRGISRVAVERYKKYYQDKYNKSDFYVEER